MVFTYEQFTQMAHKNRVYGEVVIKGYSIRPNSTGAGRHIAGYLESKGSIPFKVWESDPAFSLLSTENWIGKEATISGEMNVFNGTSSVIVQAVGEPDNPNGKEAYFQSPYNPELLLQKLNHIVTHYLTENGQKVFQHLWSLVGERMTVEFAAVAHHDSCMHGLLAHTVKTTTLTTFLLKNYKEIAAQGQDAIILGAIFHDVGKIWSYDWGYYSDKSRELSHNMLGAQFIISNKRMLVGWVGESVYNTIVSVIEQHHGEHGEPPRTLAAYIVHCADNLDAHLTDIESQLTSPMRADAIKLDDWYLYTNK